MKLIRVILADDHAITREGTRQLLAMELDIDVIAESADGEETIRLTQELRPDILLLDISMPGMNGIQVTQVLRRTVPETRIIILTGYDNRGYANALARLGVSGYLSKTATSQELINVVHAVHAGQVHFQSAMAGAANPGADIIIKDDPTPRELEVLHLVAQGNRNRDIARQLSTSERTVQFHLSNLFTKFHASSRTELIHLSQQTGWLA